MYAIIKTGAKQYRVKKDDIIDVEIIASDEGAEVEFSDVLFISNGSTCKIGQNNAPAGLVKGVLLGKARGRKVDSIKYKRRKNQHTRWGHRQNYSRIKVTEITS